MTTPKPDPKTTPSSSRDIRVPYLRTRGGRHYWDPSSELRQLGWKARTLSANRAEAIAQAEALNAEVAAWRLTRCDEATGSRPAAGTLAAVIADYKATDHYTTELAAKTRYDYAKNLDTVLAWAGDEPVVTITRKEIKKFYKKMHKAAPARADYIMRVLRIVLAFAVEEEVPGMDYNPMTDFEMLETKRKVEPALWTDEAIAAYVDAADASGRPSLGTAVMINAWLGQREGDLIRMPRTAYAQGAIWVRQRKTDAEVDLPIDEVPVIAARLREELARSSAVTILCSESTGRPYSEDHFCKSFAAIRDQVPDCAGLRFMWLRHTAVTRMAEAGCSN